MSGGACFEACLLDLFIPGAGTSDAGAAANSHLIYIAAEGELADVGPTPIDLSCIPPRLRGDARRFGQPW